jgi:flagellar biosynthesis/type III secretory pathway M-ring protein FliF/YscJ
MGVLEAASVIVKLLFAAGILAALAWFVLRPVIQSWRQQPNPDDLMPKLPEITDEELQIPSEPGGKPGREEMLQQARADPHRAATVLKQWLREKERERKVP